MQSQVPYCYYFSGSLETCIGVCFVLGLHPRNVPGFLLAGSGLYVLLGIKLGLVVTVQLNITNIETFSFVSLGIY